MGLADLPDSVQVIDLRHSNIHSIDNESFTFEEENVGITSGVQHIFLSYSQALSHVGSNSFSQFTELKSLEIEEAQSFDYFSYDSFASTNSSANSSLERVSFANSLIESSCRTNTIPILMQVGNAEFVACQCARGYYCTDNVYQCPEDTYSLEGATSINDCVNPALILTPAPT